ncbi:MAG: chromate transporter [Lachnospiraceae bacterium]|nr:chromate transporter [Lachnospiraceae bacterium]
MSILLDLFLTFCKIGFFTFGGGLAMLSMIEEICVEKKQWISHEDAMTVTAVAESTPGPIAINLATYIGFQMKGTVGAVVSTTAMVLPSLILITVIAACLEGFLTIPVIANAFKGIKLAVGILVLDAALKMIRKMKKQPVTVFFLLIGCVCMLIITVFSLRISVVLLMFSSGALSLLMHCIAQSPKNQEKKGAERHDEERRGDGK